MGSMQRSILFAFIGALHPHTESSYSGPEYELGRLLATGQSYLAAGKAEPALQIWTQCQERDTTGIADIGTIESLIRLGSTHEATKELKNLLERDQQNRLSHILIHIMFELGGSLYIAVLDRYGEIPRDVFNCLNKVIKFSDDLLQQNPALEKDRKS